jgi:acetolactate synthase-1/2/3 large subunit
MREGAVGDAGRIADAAGAELLRETFTARIERGAGRVAVEAIPYFGEAAAERLEMFEALVLVGAAPPVSFFGYPGRPSWLAPEGCEIVTLAEPRQDVASALASLADALGCPKEPRRLQEIQRPTVEPGKLNPHNLAAVVANELPEGAVVSDESATAGVFLQNLSAGSPPHDWLMLTGGSIGQGISVAVGAAVACPNRRVLCLHGDGGAMYTLQALWTQAREGLDITTVILANRSYAILNIELKRVGASAPGRKALDMLDLSRPDLDWVKLAEGMGVPGTRARTAEELQTQIRIALSEPGPRLIEAVL